MKVGDSIRHALQQVVVTAKRIQFEKKVADHHVFTRLFNAQRRHRHPATLSPVRRAKLRRS